jgi:hypothetical protein
MWRVPDEVEICKRETLGQGFEPSRSLEKEDLDRIIQEEDPSSNAQTENPCMRTNRKKSK